MTKVLALTYSAAHEHQSHIIRGVLIACAFLLALYAANVYAVISRTVALESIQKQTAALSTQVDSLDSQYLQLSSRANPDSLGQYGFTQGQVSAFISRTTSLGSVATRVHEL